jgi:hypothetical protein
LGIQTSPGWRLDLLQGRSNDLIGTSITAAGSPSFVLQRSSGNLSHLALGDGGLRLAPVGQHKPPRCYAAKEALWLRRNWLSPFSPK